MGVLSVLLQWVCKNKKKGKKKKKEKKRAKLWECCRCYYNGYVKKRKKKMYVCMYVHTKMYVCMYAHVCMHVCTYVRTHVLFTFKYMKDEKCMMM